MGAEIICIGTELLLGEILNSNAQYLASELAALGIPHHYQTVVGDNIPRIHQVLELARQRSQIVLFTGGLGPTPDDLTHEAIASFFETPLVEDLQLLTEIERKFAERGRVMSPSNRKQAFLPQGASALPNPVGSAPGAIWEPEPDLLLLTFPGVPREMHRMWTDTAIPTLRSRGWGREIFHSQVLRFWGTSESGLAEQLGELFDSQNPTVAPYAGKGEVRIRVTARAETAEAARALMAPIVKQIQQIGGSHYYGSDDDTLASVVGDLLQQSKTRVALAETCTGGWIGQQLTAIPGSSAYFAGSVVAYDNAVKESVLDVDKETAIKHGSVSAEVVTQMALGVKRALQSDWGVAISGIAGPGGGSEEKPVGLTYVAIARPDGSVETSERRFGARRGREWVRWLASQSALDRLRRNLLAASSSV
ncbi:MAG: competence/damage-inducible protein A [Cyanobacteria bacterium P01_D01_bin.123]